MCGVILQDLVERELSVLGGNTSCVVRRLEGNSATELVSIAPIQRYPAASLAKVPILVEVARQVEVGTLAWNTPFVVPERAHATSSGVLASLSPQLRPTLHDLAHLMIAISDNTASNVLLDSIGMDAVNATMQSLGLHNTRLERHFMDMAARQAGRENWTTANDMAALFSLLDTRKLAGRDVMLEMLLRQNDNSSIPGYWDQDVTEELPYAHKTGELGGILHDAGIYNPPYPHYPHYLQSYSQLNPQYGTQPTLVIALLTSEQKNIPLTRFTMARIGLAILQQSAA